MEEAEITKKTAIDWGSFCREVVYDMMNNCQQPLGGPGRTVEIDESKFGKRKYNRGKHVEGQWVFGLIERETGRVVLAPVDKRDKDTLIPIIKRWVLPSTTIISDLWKAYNCLESEGYIHLTVNHSLTFKDPETGANTNRIEATWRAAKSKYGSSGRRSAFFPGYLAKYAFLKYCSINNLNPFVEFLKHAAVLYSPLTSETALAESLSNFNSANDRDEETVDNEQNVTDSSTAESDEIDASNLLI